MSGYEAKLPGRNIRPEHQAQVSGPSLRSKSQTWLSGLKPRVQIVVLPRAGFAEFIDLQRQRQAVFFKRCGEVLFDRFKQHFAGCPFYGVRAARGDLQVRMQEGGVGPAVCNAVLLATQGAYADAAERINALVILALRVKASP